MLKPHEIDAVESIAAGIGLGEEPVDGAIRSAVLLPPHYTEWAFGDTGDHPQYAELGAALRQRAAQAVLAEGGRDLPA
ncbi:hypothetical protein WJ47_12380 [Burkholderia ubonensis]|uniref:Uncharacterized protein n=1 Tax=Burkholderia ubonensis TaxID=101571 RepID=A0AB73FVZ1_9BURK|nr:hypothetical protein [Burkholderia ubonensis]KVK87619.1 hypothetical protein WJ44_32850 [Burkholderia ubonensis]KVL66147.1 hypothetical protein WJ47_12380 [Burkholderia ubonensis]KVM19884.1 hypothetical protein WJ53_22460 [Burkholderia ubonensis]KVM26766.1 hypothetical protein WJ54_16060 [Burkholderia ubonensis]